MAIAYVLFFISLINFGKSVPPAACFSPFNWQDCGRPPVHVLYYYKPGSRCEVGIWRGCLPNQNMFKDEYECVNTCIFVERAKPEDFHVMANEIELSDADIRSLSTFAPDKNTDADLSQHEQVESMEDKKETAIDPSTTEKSTTTNSPTTTGPTETTTDTGLKLDTAGTTLKPDTAGTTTTTLGPTQ